MDGRHFYIYAVCNAPYDKNSPMIYGIRKKENYEKEKRKENEI